jgi:hypothetical protein
MPDLIVEHFYGKAALPTPNAAVASARIAETAGTYLTSRRAHGGLEGFATWLTGTSSVTVGDDGRSVILRERRWVPIADDVFQDANGVERVAFQRRNGRISGWLAGNGAVGFERLSVFEQPLSFALTACIALLAAVFALAGPILRAGRGLVQSEFQAAASHAQLAASALWLTTGGLFVVWVMSTNDALMVVKPWPSATLVGASTLALVAALTTLGCAVAMPWVWRAQAGGWRWGRKFRFTLTVVISLSLAALLARGGLLAPWAP